MAARFCVLASGSSGNASFLDCSGFGILIDVGIGPRLIAARLASIGASWKNVNAVVLTHTHSDHWKERTLAQLRSLQIPLYCHPGHRAVLEYASPAFETLRTAKLLRNFVAHDTFEISPGLNCLPVPVPHDSDPTYAFRIDGPADLFGPAWSLGYAADLGTVPPPLLTAFRGVEVLALEFNHDVALEERSQRPRHLIQRVLGDEGHLSNRQAARACLQLFQDSAETRLRTIVQLHLSRECNTPRLAQGEIVRLLGNAASAISVVTATQDRPTNVVNLEGSHVK